MKTNKGSYERFSENFKEIAFSHKEITEAVESAGFKIINTFAEKTFDEPQSDTERVYYVIRREY